MVAVSFNEAKELVKKLVKEKNFPRDGKAPSQKLLWAFVELGEAADAYKKGKDLKIVVEELVDTMFYILDFIGLVENMEKITLDVDNLFMKKWKINMNRPRCYGQIRELR
jgi:NTP pyrophosphatase (non-canonical NTP hydrolase)